MNAIFVFLIGGILGLLATVLFEAVLKSNKKWRHNYYQHHKLFWGYHIHHSSYGLISIAASLILFFINERSMDAFFLAFGLGIIIQHTISDGRFVFIEKQKGFDN